MSEHTAWQYVEAIQDVEYHILIQQDNADADTTAVEDGIGVTWTEANAHLIAAAPELLELLETATRVFGGHSGSDTDPLMAIDIEQRSNLLNRIKLAIAKAQGTS